MMRDLSSVVFSNGTQSITAFIIGVLILSCLAAFILSRNKHKRRYVKSGIRDIDYMDGFQFEEYLAYMFRANDYKVQITPERKDFGADLILKQSGKKIAVQAKRHKAKIGIKAVQEIVAAKHYYKADEAWVITNNYFTNSAKELAGSNDVRLLNRSNLIELMNKLNPAVNKTAKEFTKEVKAKPINCICGNEMISKENKKTGENFYGCSTYPKCKHTKSML